MKQTPSRNDTDFIEKTLEKLVREHGLARVQEDLKKILPRARWSDWQRLANIAQNVSRRVEEITSPRIQEAFA